MIIRPFRFPRRLLLDNCAKEAFVLTEGSRLGHDRGWLQMSVDWSPELRERLAAAHPSDKPVESYNMILHTVMGNVGEHTDNMSKRCMLFPIRVGKGTKLFVGKRVQRLHLGQSYQFSDYVAHGLHNSPRCVAQFITID